MARKQDTRAKVPKAGVVKARRSAAPAKAVKARSSKPRAGKATAARALQTTAATFDAVTVPVVAAAEKGKKKAKKALKAAKAQALGLVPEVHAPSLGGVPAQVGEAFKTIGSQIAGALNTDVGRVMVAEMLIFVAKSLTKAAAGTEAAGDAKSAILNAGAKIGAAAADAGAKAAEAGSDLMGQGKAAFDAGVGQATEAGSHAKDLVREVAGVAIQAVGGAVADVAQKAIARRRGRPPAAEKTKETPSGSEAAPAIVADAGKAPTPV